MTEAIAAAAALCCVATALPASAGAGTAIEIPTVAVSAGVPRARRRTLVVFMSGAGSTDGTSGAPNAEMKASGRGQVTHAPEVATTMYAVTSVRSESAMALRCTTANSAPGAAPGAESKSSNVTTNGAAGLAEGLAPGERDAVGVALGDGDVFSVAGELDDDAVPELLGVADGDAPTDSVADGVLIAL